MNAGLSQAEALRRLTDSGPNELARARPTSRLRLLGRQLSSPLICVTLVGGLALATCVTCAIVRGGL